MTIPEPPAHPSPPATMSLRNGVRALITRPRPEAAGLAEELSKRGIEPIIEPLLDIRFRTEPAPDLRGVQAILCTSANGVRAFARLAAQRGLPLFAVGDATATRAREEGFTTVHSAAGNVEDLARLVAAELRPDGGRLLHVAASMVAGDLAGELLGAGFALDRAVLYEAAPAVQFSAGTTGALRTGIIDFALFFSPRTAAIFSRLANQGALSEAMRFVRAVSISAAADEALGTLPFSDRRVADTPDQTSLLGCVDNLLAERQP
ncbi:MAG: uroporphyrinogen-III synthase [Alphaproteobacteria bacterium]|nr:uroporphyrinogen-III synthase [Alphaproteobacteria bacterium]